MRDRAQICEKRSPARKLGHEGLPEGILVGRVLQNNCDDLLESGGRRGRRPVPRRRCQAWLDPKECERAQKDVYDIAATRHGTILLLESTRPAGAATGEPVKNQLFTDRLGFATAGI